MALFAALWVFDLGGEWVQARLRRPARSERIHQRKLSPSREQMGERTPEIVQQEGHHVYHGTLDLLKLRLLVSVMIRVLFSHFYKTVCPSVR